ncbi:hypothetical protein [Kribbella sp. NPDC051620]|uniref:hypothetical protein n=1 Tax=Kribbella sp. NPDC051620 TaxID=3364120 RepID=UPI00378F917A
MRARWQAVTMLAALVAIATTGCGSGEDQGAQPHASASATTTSTPPPGATSPSGQPSASQPPKTTSAPVATEISGEDKETLLAVLGPAARAQLCQPAEGSRVECGRVVAAASRLIAQLQASMKGMPKSKPYKDFADELCLFQKAYSTSKRLGCFGPKAPKNPEICETVGGLPALSYLAVTTELLY